MSFVGDLVGDVFGGVTGAKQAAQGAEKASDAQVQATRESNDFLRQVYNQQRADNAQGAITGQVATNALLALYGLPQVTTDQINAYNGSNALANMGGTGAAGAATGGYQVPTFNQTPQQMLQADPSYQWRLDQGQQALERSAAARGGLLSGAALKDTTAYGQGMASTEYANVANRLSALAGFGSQATQANNAAAGNLGNQTSQNLLGAGNARASSYITGGNVASNTFNSLAGLAGGVAGGMRMSDRRLKSNIRRIGTHASGLPWYEYDIFGRSEQGVMADEAQALKPDAVVRHPSGYLMVNYGDL